MEKKKLFMSVLNEIAARYAKDFKYTLESEKEFDKNEVNHPLNICNNDPIVQVRYKGEGNGSYIKTRQRFGSPRIDISSPNQKWFVGLEFEEDGSFSECQIFNPIGIKMMPMIKAEIDGLWALKLKEVTVK